MVESLTTPKPPAPAEAARDPALADIELNLLLEAVARYAGHDFRDYAQATLRRRVAERVRDEGLRTISGLQERVLHDPQALARFVYAMTGGDGAFFSDPALLRTFRLHVVGFLRTYSFARIWIPNCGRGEEVYSLASVLREEGLLERVMIYATDPSEMAIGLAKAGLYEVESPDDLRAAQRASGSGATPSSLGTIDGSTLRVDDALKANTIFAQHSVVSDGSLNEFHVIVARGVLTQFNKALQFRVHNLFLNSLIRLGFLCLGPNESLKQTPHERVFRRVGDAESIYRRMR